MTKKITKLISIVFLFGIIGVLGFMVYNKPQIRNNEPLQIEFYVCNSYDIPHMAPIVKELENRGVQTTCFVKEPGVTFKDEITKKNLMDYHYKILEILEYYGIKAQEKRNYNADVVLSSQISHRVRKYKHMKIKIGYGACPQIQDCHKRVDNIEGYDGFLIHGQFEVDKYSTYFPADRLKIMGAPKFDSFFQHPPNKEELKRKWNLVTDKKIIVYLPTWDQDYSINLFEEAIIALKEDYMVICKPHNNTYRFDYRKPDQEKLERMATRIIDPGISLSELAIIADLLLTDIKSGATTESLYLTQGKTPWIGLTPLSLDSYFPIFLTAGPVLNDPTQLKATVEQILKNDPYVPERIILNNYCYGSPSGPTHCAKDAANAIIEFAHMQPQSKNYPYVWKKLQISLNKRKKELKALYERILGSSAQK